MDVSRLVRRCATVGVRAAGTGVHLAAALGATSVHASGAGVAAIVSGGVGLVTMPLRLGADLMSGSGSIESVARVAREFVGGPPSRRCWRGGGRAWVEVRGLTGASGPTVAATVLAAVRAHPGVASADVNFPLSRLVISVAGDGPALDELCDVVDGAEVRAGRAGPAAVRQRVPDLPGDGVVLAGRLAAVTANAAGLCAAVAGRALGLPRLPGMFSAAVTVVDYQPRLRRLIEDRLGSVAADTVIGLAAAAAYTVTQAPGSLVVDLGLLLVQAAESRSGQRAWLRWEPSLAERADCPDSVVLQPRPQPRPPGPVERHADRSGLAQAVGAMAIGVATRRVSVAATAAVVASPKATRSARESFAGTLGRGLADRHTVLALRPEALRRLAPAAGFVGAGPRSTRWLRRADLQLPASVGVCGHQRGPPQRRRGDVTRRRGPRRAAFGVRRSATGGRPVGGRGARGRGH
jgi:cation-transporting ATPase I